MSISVVIPAYNASRFLAATLRSVLAQTIPVLEILVIDDGSTDDTAEIAEAFGAPVRVFRRPNSRQGASRNFGVAEAKGNWIAFLDADDLWQENKLELQMQVLGRTPNADLCYTGRVRFTEDQHGIHLGAEVKVPPSHQIGDALLQGVSFLPSSVLMRRSVFLAVGGFATHFKVSEDWDLWIRLVRAQVSFAACREPLVLYRMHDKNVTASRLTMLEENTVIFYKHALPRIRRSGRWMATRRFLSDNKADTALFFQARGDARDLAMMAKSILHWPCGNLSRYKVLVSSLFARFGAVSQPAPTITGV